VSARLAIAARTILAPVLLALTAAVLAAAVLASAATASEEERFAMATVRLTTEPGVATGCTPITMVKDDSVKDLRRKIVRAGGNLAVLTFGVDDMSVIYADVFRCASNAGQPPRAAPRRPPAAAAPPSAPAAAPPPPPPAAPPAPPGTPPPPPPGPSR
jgi:hypothetical protein